VFVSAVAAPAVVRTQLDVRFRKMQKQDRGQSGKLRDLYEKLMGGVAATDEDVR
jgi:hypothetical protein